MALSNRYPIKMEFPPGSPVQGYVAGGWRRVGKAAKGDRWTIQATVKSADELALMLMIAVATMVTGEQNAEQSGLAGEEARRLVREGYEAWGRLTS